MSKCFLSYSLPPSGYSPYLRGRVWLGEVAAKQTEGYDRHFDTALWLLDARVVGRGDLLELFFERVGNVEGVDEFGDGRLGNSIIGSRERLEGFVGIGVAFAPEDGLDGFGDNCPVLFEVLVNGFTVDDEFVEPFEGGFHGDDGVCEGHANVAKHGGVREVALET